MTVYGNRGGRFGAGLVVCTALTFAASLTSAAGTNAFPNAGARAADEKSAVVNVALQLFQQLQSQQQATLRAAEQAQHQAEVSSRRTMMLTVAFAVVSAMLVYALDRKSVV